jgi:ABC-2 type transport system permease protein
VSSELVRRGVLDHRRALVGWCLGIAGYTLLASSIFPSFKGSPDLTQLVERYPDALKALFGISGGGITTGAGYTDAELFSLMLPLIVLVLAIGSGARAFAGEEDAGRLELLLSYPLRRRDAVLAKGAALAAEVVLVCFVGFCALAVWSVVFGMDLSM